MERDWPAFLAALESAPLNLPPVQADAIRQVWRELHRDFDASLSPPHVQAGDEPETVQMSWSRPAFYLEVVVHPDASLEWYVRNPETKKSAGTDAPVQSIGPVLANGLQAVLGWR
jgi:hypothetical protein